MKQDKKLIKVIATTVTGTWFSGKTNVTTTARGITALKRGQTLLEFIGTYMQDRNVVSYTLHDSGENTWSTNPISMPDQDSNVILTYHFIQFLSADLGYHAKDLNATELVRDLKQLKKTLYG